MSYYNQYPPNPRGNLGYAPQPVYGNQYQYQQPMMMRPPAYGMFGAKPMNTAMPPPMPAQQNMPYVSPYAQPPNQQVRPQAYPTMKKVVRYKIPPKNEAAYTNMFSLLCTIEELETQFCEGNIDPDTRARLMKDFLDQFTTVQKVLNLSIADVESFIKAVNIQLSYAFEAIKNPNLTNTYEDTSSTPVNLNEAINLGSYFTTLSDYCVMKDLDVYCSDVQEIVHKIKLALQNIGTYQKNETARQLTDKWVDIFNKYKPTDLVPPNLKEDLMNEMTIWRNSAYG